MAAPMELVSRCPLPVGSLLWQSTPGVFRLTVIAKATFVVEPPEAYLASEQEPICNTDTYGSDASWSMRCPSDLVPAKSRADVLLVGHAYAPGGKPIRSLVARLKAGGVDKAIEVVRDRALLGDGTRWEGGPFVKMPLVYERAAGGPDTGNPVGKPWNTSDAQGIRALPNLQRPGTALGDVVAPVGFGPIAPTWPGRRMLFSRYAPPPADLRVLQEQPMPADVDFRFFNAAPTDQQVDTIPEDIRITLEHLHPVHSHLSTVLPGLHPYAMVERPGPAAEHVSLRCDTLWIDTDRGICTLVWRGQLTLVHAMEPGRVSVMLKHRENAVTVRLPEARDEKLPEPLARFESNHSPEQTLVAPMALKPALPFAPAPKLGPEPQDDGSRPSTPPSLVQPPYPLPDAVDSGIALFSGRSSEPVRPPAPELHAEPEPARGLDPGEVLHILWYASESMARIRRRKAWKAILDEVDERPIDPELEDAELSATPADVENRRAIAAILTRGEPLGPEALARVLAEGVHEGTFTPKIALAAGELWLPLSELALLEALAAAVMPLAAEDEKLRAAVKAANDFTASSWAASTPAVAEGLGARIKELLRQGRRAVPLAAIESQVERAALEQRAYQKRTVLGGFHLRALLLPGPGSGTQAGVPAYLPERLSAELPMFQRFRVRLLAEVHPPVDQQEAAPVALRVVALGRVMGIGR